MGKLPELILPDDLRMSSASFVATEAGALHSPLVLCASTEQEHQLSKIRKFNLNKRKVAPGENILAFTFSANH